MTNSLPFPCCLYSVGLFLPLQAGCTYVGKMDPLSPSPEVRLNSRKPNNQETFTGGKDFGKSSLIPLPSQVGGKGTEEMLETLSNVIIVKECFFKLFSVGVFLFVGF